MNNVRIPVDDNLFSTLEIGTKSFPFGFFHDDLNHFQKSFVNWHKQKEIEISYVLEGSLKVCLLKEEHTVSSGNAFLIFPDSLHSIQPVDQQCGKYFTLIFDPCLLIGYPNSFFDQSFYTPALSASRPFVSISNTPKLQDIFSVLFWFYHNSSAHSASDYLNIQRNLQDIWILLFQNVFDLDSNTKTGFEDAKILQMITYLRENYAEKFSLTSMAETLHVSRGECCRYFKKMMGMTISDYLLEYRLGKAIELLEVSNASITKIAHTVGFNSVSNFSALFKEKTGHTPSTFRTILHDHPNTDSHLCQLPLK